MKVTWEAQESSEEAQGSAGKAQGSHSSFRCDVGSDSLYKKGPFEEYASHENLLSLNS